jgi:hypothetical protein
MLQSVVQKRALHPIRPVGVSTDKRLNHHPTPREGVNEDEWLAESPLHAGSPVYIRAERQNLIGFPEVQAFFSPSALILYDVEELQPKSKWR